MIEKKYLKFKILYIFSLKLPFTRIFLFFLLVLHTKWLFLLIRCLKCAIYSISRVRVRVRVRVTLTLTLTLTLTPFTISHLRALWCL